MSPTDPGAQARCPEERLLRRLLDAGPESEATLEQVCAHVDVCPACQQRLQALSDAEPEPRPAPPREVGPAPGIDPAEVDGFVRKLWGTFRATSEAAQIRDAMAAVRGAVETASLGSGPIGPYRIERCAGKGGMSVVYRAIDTRLNRAVALKMLRDRPGDEAPGRRERIEREAAVLARLSHPHIVPLYEVGEHQGQRYLVLEYIAGPTLSHWLRGRVIGSAEAARAVQTLAGAVHHAHEHGVIHRDLKPGNILLRPWLDDPPPEADAEPGPLSAYRPMITDFGLARWRDQGDRLTLSNEPVGTPAYMAPEQVHERDAAIGPATDVYALGAILYELLTGRPPLLASTTVGTLQLIEGTEPVPPRRLEPSVPRDLETITLKCLEKDPRRRYSTAAALAQDLERFLGCRPIQARPVHWPGRLLRWGRRNPAVAATGALALALMGALAGGGVASALVQRQLRARAESREQQALQAEAQAGLNLRSAIFLLDELSTGFRQLAATADPQVQGFRQRCYERGVQWCQQYLERRPASTAWNLQDLQVAIVLIKLQAFRGQARSAERLARQARQAADRLGQGPGARARDALQAHEATYYNLAQVHTALGQPTEALACLEQVDRVLTQRLAFDPGSSDLIGQRFSIQGEQARHLDQLGEPERALAVSQASLDVVRDLQARHPGILRYWLLDAQRVLEIADRLGRLGRLDEARALLLQGLVHLDQADVRQAFESPEFQALRHALLRRWLATLADVPSDRLAPALAEFRTRTAGPLQQPVLPPELDLPRLFEALAPLQAEPPRSVTAAALIELAALHAALARQPDPDPARRTADLDQALSLLGRAQAAGALSDPAARQRLAQHPAFAGLRPEPRFQRWLDASAPAAPTHP